MEDSLNSNLDWYETLNGKTGIFAIAVVIIFVSIIIIIFIVRIIQFPHLRQQIINYFIADSTRSVPTRILKMIIFLFLTAGLVGVIYFNVYKMIHYPPKLSMSLEEVDSPPSMLFCPTVRNNSFEIISAGFYENFHEYINVKDGRRVDLIASKVFKVIPGSNNDCRFFDSTLFSLLLKKKNFARGIHELFFNSPEVVIYMGDNNNVNWTQFIPQGNKFSNVDSVILRSDLKTFEYIETRTQVLNGTIYRSFEMSYKGNLPSNVVGIRITAPTHVTKVILRPSLTLVELFSSVGGYLSIWGIVVFLFGRDKMDPFGFVSRYIFIEQDKTKLLEELKKMQYDKSIKQNKIDIVTETSNLDDQVELENLLAKYYVHMDFYKHAVKTSDV
ncbi:hypothetical protein C1646_776089 [Rhizophagus diaphanus]|nr:hypothetical protein C1646_776089 [Rhizophagus diaphanus] [Rhizophagus sp. MUCL 43196]